MVKKSDNSKYHVPNLERALTIMEHLSQHPAGLTASEISEQLKIPRNSIFRITSTLVDTNYLIRDDETKKYQLSQKLLTMGYSALGEQTLIEKALPVMRELRDELGETVPLGILHGNEGLIVEEVPGKHSFRFVLEPGRKFHLHTSAPAKSIIAFLKEDEKNKIISTIEFQKYNERTILSAPEYKKHLLTVQQKGFGIDYAEEIEGMICIAAPIFNYKGYPFASIWISGPSFRIKEKDFDKIGNKVIKYADRISRSLGFDPKFKK
ncbi:MAG: IclR family transcriptional regulator [Melioribacteraceae bacterium]|jgi:DNA-binding IclR family transcriptional regulator|nr:IclR family transcriptional regulator [Melioribacteraceae bacterium]